MKETKEKKDVKVQENQEKQAEIQLTEEEKKLLEEAQKEMDAPIALVDKEFIMAKKEIDIRKLSKTNKDQVTFRLLCQQVAYLRAVNQSMVDLTKLLMLVLKKLGVEDIIEATDILDDQIKAELTKKEARDAKKGEKTAKTEA